MVSTICKSSYLSGQYAGSSSVSFCKSKLQLRQKIRAVTQMDHSSTSSKILFHGLPSKSKRPSIVSGNSIIVIITFNSIVFTKQPSAERYLANIFLLVFFARFQHPFYKHSCKKGVVRKLFAKFTRKHLCQRLKFNNVAGLRL